jgi:hypothetical protein
MMMRESETEDDQALAYGKCFFTYWNVSDTSFVTRLFNMRLVAGAFT